MSPSSFNVVILGGGAAGCATALALRQRGVDDILVVEAGAYNAYRIGESIPPDTRLLLEKLDLWPDFLSEGHDPCLGSRSSWGADEVGYNDFLFNPHGVGWHLDRRRFEAFLAEKTRQRGAELRLHTRFIGAAPLAEGGFELQLRSPQGRQLVAAQIVVDATGAHARFAQWAGAKKRQHDRLSWISAVLTLPGWARLSQLSMLEAVEYGWWYAARLPAERLVAAVATDAERLKWARLHQRESWLAHLQQTRHMAAWLQGHRVCENPGIVLCAAPSFLLDKACGRDWLAVGDAASAYDPIAAQGIYKALLNGLQAAAMIADYREGQGWGGDAYHEAIAARFADYLKNRNYFYHLEQRWASAPFWRRRQKQTAGLSLDV